MEADVALALRKVRGSMHGISAISYYRGAPRQWSRRTQIYLQRYEGKFLCSHKSTNGFWYLPIIACDSRTSQGQAKSALGALQQVMLRFILLYMRSQRSQASYPVLEATHLPTIMTCAEQHVAARCLAASCPGRASRRPDESNRSSPATGS